MTEPNANPRLDTDPLINKPDIPLLDPTVNVQNLLQAAVVRMDDLAAAEQMRVNERTAADMLRLDQLRTAESRRMDESIAAERRRVDEQLLLREHYEEALRVAEAKRIDANRAGDAAAVATANERAMSTANTLANQVSTSADNLRTLVNATAATVAQNQQAVIQPMMDRIAKLEQTSYEGAGRARMADPVMDELVRQVSRLTESMNTGSGRGLGAGQTILYIVMAVTMISTILSILTYVAK